jgi:predicted RecB family nuclease
MHVQSDRLHLSPSDVTAYLACEHLTTLSLRAARGEIETPAFEDEQRDLVFRKGLEHERAYLESLRAPGKTIVEIDVDALGFDEAVAATHEAIAQQPDVIYQAAFAHDGWRGVADFLLLREDGVYEALDTKLARKGKPSHILQLLFYDGELERIQGPADPPRQIHVLLGNLEQQSFEPREFAAYYRRVRSRLREFVDDPPPTEPYPNDHCPMCDFRPVCEAWWEEVDHLSRVAGLYRTQIERLAAAGITTLTQLGRAPAEPAPDLSAETWTKLREQAALQLHHRETGENAYKLLPLQAEAGFALLPEPSPGDLFFDFEGNPFWDRDGSLEYLWGILDVEGTFTPLHAHDRETERQALETFVDLVRERLREFPDLHVYHYAAYEITALRRLMGRYGTREAEVDDLLRRGVFVDLLKVVRNGLRASRPGYGLKELEAFLDFERQAEVRDGGTSIVIFERWMQTGEQELLDQIDAYNREDCLATRLLRDWLLERKHEAIAEFGPIPPPEPPEPPREPRPEKEERAALRAELLEAGHELPAHLLDYHDRERKPVWWAYFDRMEQTPEELLDDAEAISGLRQSGEPERVARSFAYTLVFPAQEHKLGAGQSTADRATGKSPGEILEVDRDERRLVLKRGRSFEGVPLPEAIVPKSAYSTPNQEDALMRFGRSLLAGDRRYPALESVLRREPFERPVQTTDLDEMKALVRSLDRRHLVIQGPPGSGKTWTSGRLIADLLARGQCVGVASTSHKAIHNLVAEVEAAAAELGVVFTGRKKASGGNRESFYEGAVVENVTDNADVADCDLAAGTAWLFADAQHDGALDYLFVDEAGQVSLADALALGTAARNLVLVGDPQQLDQVIQGTHPGGSEASVLKHLLGEHETVPPDRGLFLERTYRLHPDVCGYVSEEFYDGRLEPAEVARGRATPLGTGLRFVPVEHEGRKTESPEEVEAVRRVVAELRAAGVDDVVVVAPYNAQVNAIAEALPDVRVGTVDKFQGQEADAVVYSMASSTGADIPRGLEFLLSRNRLNVAVSRARCLAYLVCSPRLLEVNARTIPQMKLANALCRFVELAR